MADGHATFSREDLSNVRGQNNPGSELKKLYCNKTKYGLKKIELSQILVRNMMSPNTRRKIESRPIIKALNRVEILAARNHLPTTHELSEINQASKYLGKKRKPQTRKNGKTKLSCQRNSD
ncbi:MAG: hypothetical protein OXS28_13205 [Gammaproteobacteria bacterium]|nr:hypothetical protein [Gammaproteobacteria bacterium]